MILSFVLYVLGFFSSLKFLLDDIGLRESKYKCLGTALTWPALALLSVYAVVTNWKKL